MSQIFTTKTSRGRAYKCLRCDRVDIRSRMTSHFYKDHLQLEQAPFYCLACSFRCVDMDAKLKHIEPNVYPAHAIKMGKVSAPGMDKEQLMMSNNPYVLTEGTDYVILSPQQSEMEWSGRAKTQGGSQLFPITVAPTTTPMLQQPTQMANPTYQHSTPTATQNNNMPSFTIGSNPNTTDFQTLHTNHNTLHTPVIHLHSPPAVTRLPQEEDVLHQLFHGYNPQEPITPIHNTSIMNNTSSLHTPILQQHVTPTATPLINNQQTPINNQQAPINNQQAPINNQQAPINNQQAPDSTILQALENMDTNICKAITGQTTITGLINGTLRTLMTKFVDREARMDEREKRLDEREERMNERETKERVRYERAREEKEQQERAKADHERLERVRLDYERNERERREEREANKRKHESEVVKQKKKK